MVEVVALASQDQMYSLFMDLCGREGVKKPSRYLLELLEDRGRPDVDHRSSDDEIGTCTASFAAATELQFPLQSNTVLGTRGFIVLIKLLCECPMLQHLDLRHVGVLTAADPFRLGPTSNDAFRQLFLWAARHPSIEHINICGHTIGTAVGEVIHTALLCNSRLVQVLYDFDGVDWRLQHLIESQLSKNKKTVGSNSRILPQQLSETITRLPLCDRKTAEQRKNLRLILQEINFGMERDSKIADRILEWATPITISEVTESVRGLQGDGKHLFIVESGRIDFEMRPASVVSLGRGMYFGFQFNTLFCGGRAVVRERGTAFKVQLTLLHDVVVAMDRKIEEWSPTLRRVPLFQPLPAWVLLTLCVHCQLQEFPPGSLLSTNGSAFDGIRIIIAGGCDDGSTVFDPLGCEEVLTESRTNISNITAAARSIHCNGGATCLCIGPAATFTLVAPLLKPVLKAISRR